METAQQSTLNKHSHFHMAVLLTLCVILDTAIKALLLQVSWGLFPEWMLGGTVYLNVWNRHLIPIPTPIPITTIPTPIPIPITTIPTPPKRTTNYSNSDSGIGVGIVVWFRLRSRPESPQVCSIYYRHHIQESSPRSVPPNPIYSSDYTSPSLCEYTGLDLTSFTS